LVLLKDGFKVKGQRSKVKGLMLLAFYLLPFTFCLLPFASAFAEEKSYRINVEGMHCKTCVYRVTKSLKKLPQVKDVAVDLDNGTATVKLNDGEDVTPEALEEAIKDSGYKPNGIKAVSSEQ
jgi:copper chaperone CopZ